MPQIQKKNDDFQYKKYINLFNIFITVVWLWSFNSLSTSTGMMVFSVVRIPIEMNSTLALSFSYPEREYKSVELQWNELYWMIPPPPSPYKKSSTEACGSYGGKQ